jgi:hypothetical protein
MRLFWYVCGKCDAERIFTQQQHDRIEDVVGGSLRERRELTLHNEPTPESGGPPQLGHCVGQLWLYATMDGENIKTVVPTAILRQR